MGRLEQVFPSPSPNALIQVLGLPEGMDLFL